MQVKYTENEIVSDMLCRHIILLINLFCIMFEYCTPELS